MDKMYAKTTNNISQFEFNPIDFNRLRMISSLNTLLRISFIVSSLNAFNLNDLSKPKKCSLFE